MNAVRAIAGLVVLRMVIGFTAMSDASDGLTFARWSKIELAFEGPVSQGRGDPNPFDVRLDVTFVGPSGRRIAVPGFYDGDGKGGIDGNVWKVRFSADELGEWAYRTRSDERRLDGRRGRFTVVAPSQDAKGFWKWGRLEAVGTRANGIRYLKFRDGPYWLKAGCDDPENFLGKSGNFDTLAKRKAAVSFLAERGVNSLYMVTHNIGGDDRDVWPWLGATPSEAKRNAGRSSRFDVNRLEEWRELFEYMQTKGVVPYLVLEDDSAWKAYDHVRYYREMVARFGYLPALLFNGGEESNENYSLRESLKWMKSLREIDPYDHPRGIHNVNRPSDDYLDTEAIDFASIQTGSPGRPGTLEDVLQLNRMAIDWIRRCADRGTRCVMVGFDEARPELDRRCWWAVYMGGGVWESHVLPPYDRPLSSWEPVWTELGGARRFMESVPFWEMQPRNDLVLEGRALCLAKVGEVYAVYLPTGGSVTLRLPSRGTFRVAWWNPANGRRGHFEGQARIAGGTRRLTAPSLGDWALRVVHAEP